MSDTRQSFIFSSESVSEGHPDKVCDRISDAVVDLYFRRALEEGMDPATVRVACETAVTTNRVVLLGETRGPASIKRGHLEDAAREAVRDIGYDQEGFHWRHLVFDSHLHEQSADIAQGVDGAGTFGEEGAGDQGIMFGYATDETPSRLPAPLFYAHRILERMAALRKNGERPGFLPDAKSQLSVRYEDGVPVDCDTLVVSTQHREEDTLDGIREQVREVAASILPEGWMPEESKLYVNPTGRFVVGGPDGDAGLTGRKIIVDTYGGAAPHGGGAFSGKDPTKVDRSAAYACRYLARNVVAAGLAKRCTLQLAYAIGVARPLSINANLHDTGEVGEAELEAALLDIMDLSPRGIREKLDLARPVYAPTAAYGHFGREPGEGGTFSWEREDMAEDIRTALKV